MIMLFEFLVGLFPWLGRADASAIISNIVSGREGLKLSLSMGRELAVVPVTIKTGFVLDVFKWVTGGDVVTVVFGNTIGFVTAGFVILVGNCLATVVFVVGFEVNQLYVVLAVSAKEMVEGFGLDSIKDFVVPIIFFQSAVAKWLSTKLGMTA